MLTESEADPASVGDLGVESESRGIRWEDVGLGRAASKRLRVGEKRQRVAMGLEGDRHERWVEERTGGTEWGLDACSPMVGARIAAHTEWACGCKGISHRGHRRPAGRLSGRSREKYRSVSGALEVGTLLRRGRGNRRGAN